MLKGSGGVQTANVLLLFLVVVVAKADETTCVVQGMSRFMQITK